MQISHMPPPGAPNPLYEVMAATKFFASESSVPLSGEKWAIVGAETQVNMLSRQLMNSRKC